MELITNSQLVKNEDFIKNILNRYDIEFTSDIKDKLFTYFNFLVEYNENVNLTALTNIDDVYIKHFADSILGVKYINHNASVCDIGTGAGFPGVVLKIVRPDIKLTLVDSLNKRVEFLKQLLKKLNINDVTVLHNRSEDAELKKVFLNTFDYVVSRAVAKLNTLCEYCLPYVKTGGKFIAYKSVDYKEELIEAKNAINILGGKFVQVDIQQLDNDTIRNFVIIEKTQDTSIKYPRSQNKPRLKPL